MAQHGSVDLAKATLAHFSKGVEAPSSYGNLRGCYIPGGYTRWHGVHCPARPSAAALGNTRRTTAWLFSGSA